MAVSPYRYVYTTPNGEESLVLDPRAVNGPYMVLRSPSGLMSSNAQTLVTRAPGQRGESVSGISVNSRVLTFQVAILTKSDEKYWEFREQLARLLAIEPPEPGFDPTPGTMVLYRHGKPVLEIKCWPEDSPTEAYRVGLHDQVVDIEFRAPSPYWKSLALEEVEFDSAGFEFPIEHPFEIFGAMRASPVNTGGVASPIFAIIRGESVNPRLRNITTGKVTRFIISLAANERIEIDTRFGQKDITVYRTGGVIENGFQYLDLTVSELWWIRKGLNEIVLDADTNVSGSGHISWESYRSGV